MTPKQFLIIAEMLGFLASVALKRQHLQALAESLHYQAKTSTAEGLGALGISRYGAITMRMRSTVN